VGASRLEDTREGAETVRDLGTGVALGSYSSEAPWDSNIHMNLHILMPSKNIAVQASVYNALAKEKRAGESFTSLFRRLLDQRGGLDELLGSWTKEDIRHARATLRRMRSAQRRG
jgi:predicted CopG family antitoxin